MTAAAPSAARSPVRALLLLAWPAATSYLLSSAYRINDQYWIQGLGAGAQSAMSAVLFVLIANFALPFLAAAGALSLVSRAVGAGDAEAADRASRCALGLAFVLGVTAALLGPLATEHLARWLALEGATARMFAEYLDAIWLSSPVLFVVPVLDHVLIGRGDTVAPMALQGLAVVLNFSLNPLFVYGAGTAAAMPSAPLAEGFSRAAEALGVEGLGIGGAAWATGASRAASLAVGLVWLRLRYGTRLAPALRVDRGLLATVVRISTPVSLSIAFYAAVYWALFAFVLDDLGDEVRAGLGIGFQVFEGVAFPTFLGISMAAASLVGRAIGARDRERLDRVLVASKRTALALGLLFAASFLVLAEPVAHLFSQDEGVRRETILYARLLALSQPFVAFETLWDKVLMASGRTRAVALIQGGLNVARLPLAWLLAGPLGLAAAGVWIAIDVTTAAKSLALGSLARTGDWRDGDRGEPAESGDRGRGRGRRAALHS
ncbi:MAG: MATE family efflux transporter [Planctomycetota bacterium]